MRTEFLGTAPHGAREATIHQSHGGDLAIRQGPWKLIFLKNGERELYNLQSDLGEAKNVLDSYADIAAKLTALMKNHIADGRSTPGAAQKNEAAMSLDGSAKGKKKRKNDAKAM